MSVYSKIKAKVLQAVIDIRDFIKMATMTHHDPRLNKLKDEIDLRLIRISYLYVTFLLITNTGLQLSNLNHFIEGELYYIIAY